MRSGQWQLGILGTILAFASEPSQRLLGNHLSICLGTILAFAWELSQRLLGNHLSVCLGTILAFAWEPSQRLLGNHLSISLNSSAIRSHISKVGFYIYIYILVAAPSKWLFRTHVQCPVLYAFQLEKSIPKTQVIPHWQDT